MGQPEGWKGALSSCRPASPWGGGSLAMALCILWSSVVQDPHRGVLKNSPRCGCGEQSCLSSVSHLRCPARGPHRTRMSTQWVKACSAGTSVTTALGEGSSAAPKTSCKCISLPGRVDSRSSALCNPMGTLQHCPPRAHSPLPTPQAEAPSCPVPSPGSPAGQISPPVPPGSLLRDRRLLPEAELQAGAEC